MIDFDFCYRKIDECKCVSFDIFDTLILRPFVLPTDLFLLIEKIYKVDNFCSHRITGEKLAYRYSLNEEVTIDEIYSRMHPKYLKFKKIEKQMEISLCKANPLAKKLYDYAVSKNKIIAITSDIYLDKNTIMTILTKNGYSKFFLFLSSDYRIKKENGSLFYRLKSSLNLNPSEIFHIGDNSNSDYNVPKSIGFNVYLFKKNVDFLFSEFPLLKKYYLISKHNVDTSVIIGLISYLYSSRYKDSFWYRFGFMYAGPVVSQFAEWLNVELKGKEIDSVAFIARDGYNIKKAFDYVTNGKYITEYVYANRKLKLLFDLDFSKYAMWPDVYSSAINSILEFYNDELHFLKNDLASYSLSEKQRIYEDNKNAIAALSKKYFNQYKNYLEKTVVGNDVAMVDGATINFSSQSLLSSYTKKNIQGYYYYREFYSYKSVDCFSFFNYKTYHEDFENHYLNWDLMEFILSSPEQSINSFKNNKFIFNKSVNDEYRSSIYSEVCEGSLEFAKCFHEFFATSSYIICADSIASFINFYCLNIHNSNDVFYFNKIVHQVFDTDCYRPMFGKKDKIMRFKLNCKRFIYAVNNFSVKIFKKKVFYKKHKKGITYYCFIFFPLFSKKVTFL